MRRVAWRLLVARAAIGYTLSKGYWLTFPGVEHRAEVGDRCMGNVVRFKQTTAEPPARSQVQYHLDAYLLALAEIDSGKAQIETDVRVVESLMRSTENPNLREITLQQLADIKDQLLLALLKLLDAKRGLLVLATTTGTVDPSIRSESAAPTTRCTT